MQKLLGNKVSIFGDFLGLIELWVAFVHQREFVHSFRRDVELPLQDVGKVGDLGQLVLDDLPGSVVVGVLAVVVQTSHDKGSRRVEIQPKLFIELDGVEVVRSSSPKLLHRCVRHAAFCTRVYDVETLQQLAQSFTARRGHAAWDSFLLWAGVSLGGAILDPAFVKQPCCSFPHSIVSILQPPTYQLLADLQ